MPSSQLKRLQDAQRKVAQLVHLDPVYLPIFERLEAEIQAADTTGDPIERARRLVALHRAKA